MNRGEHAGAHQEGADQGQRERQHGEQDRPYLERIALFHHHRRVQQRRAGEPRQHRGVLDRVPEPPAAPAKGVIGPVGPHGDAEGQKDPGRERPRPHPACPGGIDAAFDQRRGGERKGDREADVAEIQQRRMHREPGVLQDRIEIAAFERRLREPRERIRRGQHEQLECSGDPRLHGERRRFQRRGQIAAEAGNQRAEQRQHQHPQQHRAFMVSPHAGDLVDQRFRGMRILEYGQEREVRGDVAPDQRKEGQTDEGELGDGGRSGDRHQHGVAAACAPERDRGLHHGESERQHEGVMAEFGDHRVLPAAAAP